MFLRKKGKLIKKEIFTSCEVLYKKFCMRDQFLFCKKDIFQDKDFYA